MGAPEVPLDGADARTAEPVDVADVLADDETYAGPDPARHRTPRRRTPGPVRSGRRRWTTRRVAALLLVLGVVVGVYGAGRPTTSSADLPAGHPDIAAMQATAVDPQVEATLLARLQADPEDVEAMRQLGTLYYGVGDFVRTAQWQEEILAARPDDVDALLALGVAEFSQGDVAGAEEHWNAALVVNPDQPEVHYNLGFLHLGQDDPVAALAAWDRVVELAPGSEMAVTVASHREALLAQAAGTED